VPDATRPQPSATAPTPSMPTTSHAAIRRRTRGALLRAEVIAAMLADSL
jgi:hypothetical protein